MSTAAKPVRRAILEQAKVKVYAGRGTKSEADVKDFLDLWVVGSTQRDFSRLTDSKAAGRIVKAAPADFEYFSLATGVSVHGLIEVKETEHEYRLARDKLPQLPRLRKREKCGSISYVLVHHTTLRAWRVLDVRYLADTGDKGSWNISDVPTFPTCGLALMSVSDVFSD